MKKRVWVIIFSLFLWLFPLTCSATELEETLGTDELYAALTEEGQEILDQTGVQTPTEALAFSWETLGEVAAGIFAEKYLLPLRNLLLAAGIIIISSFLGSYNRDCRGFCELAGALGICSLVVPYIAALTGEIQLVCEGVGVFLLASIPVYVSLLVASGNVLAGSSYGGVSIFAANILSQISSGIIIPCISVFLGLSVSAAFSHINIKNITESIYKFLKWLMVLAVTAFSGIVSVQSVIAGATDAASLKTARLVASTAIPIVGGAFSDGVTAVQYSLKVLKSGAGAFGILAALALFLAPVIQTLLWMGSLQITVIVADLFDAKKIKEFLAIVLVVLKMLLAVLLSLCLIALVTAAITLFVGIP